MKGKNSNNNNTELTGIVGSLRFYEDRDKSRGQSHHIKNQFLALKLPYFPE